MKRNTTIRVQEETPTNLRTLAKVMGITHERGIGAPNSAGNVSGLLDYISHLIQTRGAETVHAQLLQWPLAEESSEGAA